MKRLFYILNIIIAMLIFASCKDEDAFMPTDNEPCYTILVSAPDEADTRAYYKEDGSNISVVWEKGDVIYLDSYEFVFKEMNGNDALFFHYGSIDNADNWTGTVTFGSDPGSAMQLQKKNNECREHLEANVTTAIDLTKRPTVDLLPADGKSLLHIQVKSPAMFVGGSTLKITGLKEEYTITLGVDPEHVFADKGETLDIYLVVQSGLTIGKGTELWFLFSEYDANDDGDEYCYVMKCNTSISTKNDEVVKLPLPNKPSRLMHIIGTSYSNLANGSVMSVNGLKDNYTQTLNNYLKDDKFDFYMLLAKTDTVKNTKPLNVTVLEPNDGDEFYYLNPEYSESKNGEVVKVKMGYPRAAIQMGLSVKWANINIGAEKETDYGLYFWWGDVVGYDDKTSFNFSNDVKNTSADTRYKSKETLRQEGIIDDSDNLVPDRDAAIQHWGSLWKMPTKENYEELLNSTYCEWTAVEDKNKGWRATSRINGKSVFFRFGGYRNNDGTGKQSPNSRCFYWSSTASVEKNNDSGQKNDCAYGFQTRDKKDNVYPDPFYIINPKFGRFSGLNIRPVRSKN